MDVNGWIGPFWVSTRINRNNETTIYFFPMFSGNQTWFVDGGLILQVSTVYPHSIPIPAESCLVSKLLTII